MRVKHLWSCLGEATREDSPDPVFWYNVIGMIQSAFCEGHLMEQCTWQTVVLVSKGNGDLCGIVLVEVMWKIVTGILNRHLMAVI